MFSIPRSVSILLATAPVDLRKSIDGLTAIVRSEWKDATKDRGAAGDAPTRRGATPGLLLKGGLLLDPYAEVRRRYDVRCRRDRVVEVGRDLASDGELGRISGD